MGTGALSALFKLLGLFLIFASVFSGAQVGSSPGVTGSSSSGNGVGSGTSPLTFGAKFDVQQVPDAVVTNASNIITCPNADCKFLTKATVGQIIFATAGTGASCLDNATSLPQTTIQSIDSDTQIHTVGNGNASGTGTAVHCLAWGDDDTAAINAAWAVVGCTGSLALPTGKSFISSAILQAIAGCPLVTNAGTGYQGQRVTGQGVSGTFLMPTLNFDFTNCLSGANGACIGNPNITDNENFSVWGNGARCAATHSVNLFVLGLAGRMINVDTVGWCAHGGGSSLIGVDIIGATDIYTYSGTNFFGSTEIQFQQNNIFFGNSNITGNAFSANNACAINFAGAYSIFSTGNTITGCTSMAAGAVFNSVNTTVNTAGAEACINFGAGTVNLLGNDIICAIGVTSQPTLFSNVSGGRVNAQNSSIGGGSGTAVNVSMVAGDTFSDLGGNTFPSTGAAGIWNLGGSWLAEGHSVKGTCTGVATASSTLGLYGTGPNETLTTCTSTTIGSGVQVQGARSIKYLYVTAGTGGTNASSGVVTVTKNGSGTTFTCTLGTGTTCQFSGTPVAVVDGDLISITFTTQAADTLANVKALVGWQ